MLKQTFSLSNDEIVQGEYFSHTNEPMFTFNPARNLVYINAAGLKRLPDMEYALIVISSSEKRLSIFPCGTGERDAVRLRSGGQNRNKPRQVRCHVDFSDKMLSLMNWKRDCRYRMIGYTAVGEYDTIIAFDLSAAAEFSLGLHGLAVAAGSGRTGERTSDVSPQTYGEFGASFDEQRNNPLIKIAVQDIGTSAAEPEDRPDNDAQ